MKKILIGIVLCSLVSPSVWAYSVGDNAVHNQVSTHQAVRRSSRRGQIRAAIEARRTPIRQVTKKIIMSPQTQSKASVMKEIRSVMSQIKTLQNRLEALFKQLTNFK